MSKTAEKIISFLSQSGENYVTVINQNNNQKVGKDCIYLIDIPNQDFDGYLKFNIGNIQETTRVWIELRKKRGTTSTKVDSCFMDIVPQGQIAQPAIESNLPAVAAPIQAVPMQENKNLQIHGLGLAEIVKMQVNEDKLEHWKEKHTELKEDFVEVKKERNLLEVENRELKTKLSTATAEKDMAVMMVKLENKSFFESDAFSKLMENAPAMIGSIASMKAGAVTAGALGSPVTSDVKRQFFDYINDNVEDENFINFLGTICHFKDNPIFMSSLNQLIQQQNAV